MDHPDPLAGQTPPDPPPPSAVQSPGPCPVCGATMIQHEVQGLALQLCNDHGHWLPAGALAEVVRRVQAEMRGASQRKRRSRKRSVRRRKAQQKAQANPLGAALMSLLGGIDLS